VQAFADVHATPKRAGKLVLGLGVDWIVQEEPVQRSASVLLGSVVKVA
jgi:hypothetical protein